MKLTAFVGKKLAQAFTLVEILTVLVIVSIMISAAIPAYENFVRENQSLVMSSRLAESLRLAQGEAIKRGLPVTVCPISAAFEVTGAFDENTEEWPCLNTSNWDAWKVFVDPNFDATEDFTAGWPIIQYVSNTVADSITANVSGPITFDPMGFANIDPSTTRSGWSWSSSYNSGESDWSWSYGYSSEYTGTYYRAFIIAPPGCMNDNARIVEITQNGLISVDNIGCDGL